MTAAPFIAVLDYGMGNRRSVEKAVERVGARVEVTADPAALRDADGIVVPGVGAFPAAMSGLRSAGLDRLIVERAGAGTPILGLCLGMQLLFDGSTELGGDTGLGLVPGTVAELEAPGWKVPHIGWNVVTFTHPPAAAPAGALIEGLGEARAFYHVHSFVARPEDEADVLGRGDYGAPFVSIVGRGRVFGAQFHPEKSSVDGLRLLANFASICTRAEAAAA